MVALQHKPKLRRKPQSQEHQLQCMCVNWFRWQHPQLKHILFAVPNGSKRDVVTARRLKDEGATAGVADLILLKSNRFYGALCIEMKTPKGRQQESQKLWQQEVEANGAKYIVCRSLDEFIAATNNYLADV